MTFHKNRHIFHGRSVSQSRTGMDYHGRRTDMVTEPSDLDSQYDTYYRMYLVLRSTVPGGTVPLKDKLVAFDPGKTTDRRPKSPRGRKPRTDVFP